jgi:hypothetical protein
MGDGEGVCIDDIAQVKNLDDGFLLIVVVPWVGCIDYRTVIQDGLAHREFQYVLSRRNWEHDESPVSLRQVFAFPGSESERITHDVGIASYVIDRKDPQALARRATDFEDRRSV